MLRDRRWLATAMLVVAGIAFGGETADFGIAPTRELRLAEHAAPTPREVPGGRTLLTAQLQAWLQRDAREQPILVDVLGGEEHDSLPGAVWLPGAGRGQSMNDAVQQRLANALQALTGGNRHRPLVFFCSSERCWLSYNAVLRAADLGYREVYWYRGGIQAWLDAGGEVEPLRRRAP